MIEEFILRRLVYVKFLYINGIEHLRRSTYVDLGLSLLIFDNLIEILFHIILDKLEKSPKHKESFYGLFIEVQQTIKKYNIDVNMHELEIKNMHKARNGVQHHGIIPNLEDLKRYESLVQEVLANCTSKIFDLNFDDISLSLLISDKLNRELYRKSEDVFYRKDFKNCIIYCVAAFERAKHNEQLRIFGSHSLFYRHSLGIEYDTDPKIRLLANAIENLNEEIEIFKLRLDYKKYQKYREYFQNINPFTEVVSDKIEDCYDKINYLIGSRLESLKPHILEQHAKFCLGFSIDSILQWQLVERKTWLEFFGLKQIPISDFV